jgi:glycosyltransferase involved in cell wall biosynthesis
MHHPKNNPTPWSRYFVSEVATERGVGNPFRAMTMFSRALWSREAACQMQRMIAAFRPDIVHAHSLYTHLSPSVLRACARRRVPVVMTVHDYALVSANYSLWAHGRPLDPLRLTFGEVVGSRFIKGSWVATAALEAIRRAQTLLGLWDGAICRYVTLSKFVRSVLVDIGIDQTKISVVPPFSDAPIAPKQSDGGYVLFAGRLEDYKGVATLIQAMRASPDVELRIAGSGPEERRLREMGRGMRVRFHGFVPGDALWDLMRGARVVIVPSLWPEAFGLVALEAMSVGTPVIVSDRGGLPEIVATTGAGTIFKAGEVQALSAAIQTYTSDMAYAMRAGTAAVRRASELGDPQRHVQRIDEVYRGCR